MRRLATDALNFLGLIARKWVLILFVALDAIALVIQILVPSFNVPAWAYALLLAIGLLVAAFQVHRDLLATLPSRPVEPPSYEVLPISFHVSFSPDVSTVRVWIYVVNFHPKEIVLDPIVVTSLQLSAGPSLADIPHSSLIRLPPRSFREINCHRPLHDGEVRALRKIDTKTPANATVYVTARAIAGRRTLHHEPQGRNVNGWFSGTPPQ